MSELEQKADKAIELLETMVSIQSELNVRQKKLFTIYSISAGFVWLIVLSFILVLINAFF